MRRAFTLPEVLVVVGILAFLVGAFDWLLTGLLSQYKPLLGTTENDVSTLVAGFILVLLTLVVSSWLARRQATRKS